MAFCDHNEMISCNNDSPFSVNLTMQQVFDEYHRVIGLMSPSHYDKLNQWLEKGMEPALLAQAILSVEAEHQKRIRESEPGAHQIRRMSYVEGILRNWYNDGLRTYYDWDTREDEQLRLSTQKGPATDSSKGTNRRKGSSVGTSDLTKEEWGWEV